MSGSLEFDRVALCAALSLLAGCVAADYGEPHYLYFDGDFGPIASPAGTVFGALTVDGVSSIATSTLYAGDPLGVTDSGDSKLAPVLGPDGFVVDASGGQLRVYTDRLSPWYVLPLPGDASAAVPAVDAAGNTYVGDANGFVSAFDIDGNALWLSDIGGHLGQGRSSLDGEGRLLLLRDTRGGDAPGYVALDTETGELLWEVATSYPWSPLHPHDGRFYGVSYGGDPDPFAARDLSLYRIFARSLQDGSLLWELDPGFFPVGHRQRRPGAQHEHAGRDLRRARAHEQRRGRAVEGGGRDLLRAPHPARQRAHPRGLRRRALRVHR